MGSTFAEFMKATLKPGVLVYRNRALDIAELMQIDEKVVAYIDSRLDPEIYELERCVKS